MAMSFPEDTNTGSIYQPLGRSASLPHPFYTRTEVCVWWIYPHHICVSVRVALPRRVRRSPAYAA